MDAHDAEIIRDVLKAIPRDQASSVATPPAGEDILYLPSHASALDPNVALVIGNRGMGKTFWASALVDPTTRKFISERGKVSRAVASLKDFTVSFAFADRQGVMGVSSNHISTHYGVAAEDYWRAVIIETIAKSRNIPGIPIFSALISDVEMALKTLAELDRHLSRAGTPILLLFDQLDQMADDWESIQRSTKGVLRLALACKSYRSIKIKIFMRPDQAADEQLFRFADASKITGPAASLRWFAVDLFALMFKRIWNDQNSREVMERNFVGVTADRLVDGVPARLLTSAELQRICFQAIAGEAMGSSTKRGVPYTWLITHLADGKQQISPRSFLTALRVSAEESDIRDGLVIDYKGIQSGVSEASNTRHAELKEDYPWIESALEPLRGQSVPVPQEDFYAIWRRQGVPQHILAEYVDSRAPLEISRADPESLPQALERSLVQLGVFEDRDDGRINVPDIFRISAGMKRKGGVPPQRRKTY